MSTSKHPFLKYLAVYTLLFGTFFSIIAVGFFISGKSFIYEARMGDGLRQHYVSLAYYGHYLREFLRNLLINHKFELPMWDFHIGYGSDILATLHYYAIGDPLNLVSAVVPYKYTEYLYDALIVLRIYLAGITFSLYSRYHKNNYFPTLLGALLYAFCQWSFVAGFKHPFFLNPCIYFPLLLIGTDKIYKEERPYLYIVTLAVSAMSNFYFFYMLGIFTVIYAVFRYFMIFGKISARTLGCFLGRFAIYSTIGILIASAIFFPPLAAVLGTDRIGARNYIINAYRTVYYRRLLPALIGQYEGHFTIIGISAVGILGVLLLFTIKKHFAMKLGFLMCMFFLAVPYAAHMFNGFSYVTNRWCWAFTMLMSYIFVKIYPEFFRLTKKQQLVIGAVLFLFGAYIFTDKYAHTDWNISAILLLLGFWVIFSLGYSYFRSHRTVIPVLLLTGISAGTVLNIYNCFFVPQNDDVHTSQFTDAGTAYEKNITSALDKISSKKDIDEYRFDQGASNILQNAQMMAGVNGGQFFFSLANGEISQFQNELYPYKPLSQNFYNLNGRSFLLKLFSMKYYVGVPKYAPYGFVKKEKLQVASRLHPGTNRNIYIYEDPDPLPFASTYDSCISRETYEKMNVMERQQALLQGVVLENSSLKECTPEDTSREIDYKISAVSGCRISGSTIRAEESDASFLLEFEGLPESELYVALDNLQYEPITRRSLYTDEQWNSLSRQERRSIEIKDEKVTNDFAFYLSADINGYHVKKEIHMVTDRNNFYGGRHNFMNNLGYSKNAVTQVLVTVQQKGIYTFDDLSIYCQPVDRLSDYTANLKKDNIEDITLHYGDVSCKADLTERKALVFSIPYSKGWSACVDGQEMKLQKANTMFMALELDAGTHEISLHYATPYIKFFLLLSVIGIFLFAGTVFFTERNIDK